MGSKRACNLIKEDLEGVKSLLSPRRDCFYRKTASMASKRACNLSLLGLQDGLKMYFTTLFTSKRPCRSLNKTIFCFLHPRQKYGNESMSLIENTGVCLKI